MEEFLVPIPKEEEPEQGKKAKLVIDAREVDADKYMRDVDKIFPERKKKPDNIR